MVTFRFLDSHNDDEITRMSKLATSIVREHYDPLLGKEQNDYMLELFQSERAIREQIKHGYEYYFVDRCGEDIGFIAFYEREKDIYLSKFYLKRCERKKGYSKLMLGFVIDKAEEKGKKTIELNVNKYNDAVMIYEKLGFVRVRDEKNDIGHGYYMDDFVYDYYL